MRTDPATVLVRHVRRFNEGVRSGDLKAMLDGFTEDAELVFEGMTAGPFVGRAAIAEAYARMPPDDEVRLLGAPRVNGDHVESDYVWASEGRRAGRMAVTVRDGAVARLLVTFE